jgi:GTPase
LSRAEVRVEDKLFSTLDAKTKRVYLSPHLTVLITDTVGFIAKLPPHLIASFRSTIQEATSADLLLHVVDLSHEQWEQQMRVVISILSELGVSSKPLLTVYNKVDLLPDPDSVVSDLRLEDPQALFISARTGAGLPILRAEILSHFSG